MKRRERKIEDTDYGKNSVKNAYQLKFNYNLKLDNFQGLMRKTELVPAVYSDDVFHTKV